MTRRFKAWFINELGHEFSKEFESGEEMETFISKASEVGTQMTGFTSETTKYIVRSLNGNSKERTFDTLEEADRCANALDKKRKTPVTIWFGDIQVRCDGKYYNGFNPNK